LVEEGGEGMGGEWTLMLEFAALRDVFKLRRAADALSRKRGE
jgi:hypothetical protein